MMSEKEFSLHFSLYEINRTDKEFKSAVAKNNDYGIIFGNINEIKDSIIKILDEKR